MKKIALVLIALFFLAEISFSQELLKISKKEFLIENEADSGAWKMLQKGVKLYNSNKSNALEAAELLIDADTYNNEIAKLKYNIGLCYLYSPNKKEAIKFLELAIEENDSISETVYFSLARAYHLTSDFDKAVDIYEKYKENLSDKELLRVETDVDKLISECFTGAESVKEQKRAYVDNLGDEINSQYNDYNPFYDIENEQLFYTSQSLNSTGGKVNKFDNSFFEDIYQSSFEDEEWLSSENIGKVFSTKENDAIVGKSANDSTIFIYRGAVNNGDLFISTKEGLSWSKPKALSSNINNKKSKESSATITADGNTLYFVSDQDGGYGGSDIFVSHKKENGKWGPSQSVGAILNTKKDEISVCLSHDDKTLYFSSNGLGGSGGFDVYKSEIDEDGNFSEAVNLGAPINTATNQISYYPLPDEKTAFYASENEESYGGFDIYKITYLGKEKPSFQTSSDDFLSIGQMEVAKIELLPSILSTVLSGKITSERTGQSISAIIEIIDKELNKVIYSESSNAQTGEYEISLPAGKNYSISVKSDSYMFASDNIEVQKSKKFQRFTRDFKLMPMKIGSAIVLKNVFFDSNKSTLRPESYAELNILSQFVKNNPNVKVEISGHTDNIGSAYGNKKLSKARAEAVVQYLVSVGTDFSRIISVGYGFANPVADNSTKEGRQTNRRVEAKIVSIQ